MPKCPECGEVFGEMAEPILVTTEHRETIDRAIASVRKDEGEMSEGRAIELICADYLSGLSTPEPPS